MRSRAALARVPRRLLRLALALALLLTALPLAAPRPVAAAACTVTNTTDAAPGSLRAHLADTNCTTIDATGVTDTITLASDLPTVTRTVSVSGPGAGSLTIDRNNPSGGVAFLVGAGGDLTLSGLTVTKATIGLYMARGGSATLTNSILTDNTYGLGFDGGGSATLTNSTVSNGIYGLYFDGGGSATLTDSTVSNQINGLFFDGGGNATVTSSTLNTNGTGLVFAGAGGSATVTNSTLSNTFAGIDFDGGGSATLTNSTLSGHIIGLWFQGGGLATVTNSTLSGNTTGLNFELGGSATLTNTLLARGTGANCTFASGGTLTNTEHNLADDGSCLVHGANGNIVVAAGATGLDPLGLQSNGGPTQTIALLPTSPALNAGKASACSATGAGNVNSQDQRGVSRPQGSGCDIGAYELQGYTLTTGTTGSGAGTVSPASGPYPVGSVVTVSATAASGSTFTGWTVDGVARGWANPLSITMDADHTVVASFAPTKSFADVPANRDDATAIRELATRGTIRGYNDTTYGPDDGVQRAQMAALIARATAAGPGTPPTTLTPPACVAAGTWDCEDWGNNFSDRNGLIASLWRNIGTLQHYQVAFGYDGAACAARGVASPCYAPTAPVSSVETIVFITRAMIAKGYWVAQPSANQPYPGVPAIFTQTVATYVIYTGGVPAPPSDWNAGATRGWFARALWQALNTYWATDGPLPDGRNAGGFAP